MNPNLWSKGTVVRHKPTKQKVTYICFSGVEDIHLVVAEPLEFADDGLREVRRSTLVPIVDAPAFALWKKYWRKDGYLAADRDSNDEQPGGAG